MASDSSESRVSASRRFSGQTIVVTGAARGIGLPIERACAREGAALAREFATRGITVNTVAPCAVNSDQLAAFVRDKRGIAARFLGVIPMGHAAELDEVSSMVLHLASREASFVTGQVISVNGGSTML